MIHSRDRCNERRSTSELSDHLRDTKDNQSQTDDDHKSITLVARFQVTCYCHCPGSA